MLDDEALYFLRIKSFSFQGSCSLAAIQPGRLLISLQSSLKNLSSSFDLFCLCVVITHLLSETSANEHQTQRLSSKLPPNQPNSVSESTPLLPATAFHFWLLLLLLLLQVFLEM